MTRLLASTMLGSGQVPKAMAAAGIRLGELLVDCGKISRAQLRDAQSVQQRSGAKLADVLVELGLVTRDDVAALVAQQWERYSSESS